MAFSHQSFALVLLVGVLGALNLVAIDLVGVAEQCLAGLFHVRLAVLAVELAWRALRRCSRRGAVGRRELCQLVGVHVGDEILQRNLALGPLQLLHQRAQSAQFGGPCPLARPVVVHLAELGVHGHHGGHGALARRPYAAGHGRLVVLAAEQAVLVAARRAHLDQARVRSLRAAGDAAVLALKKKKKKKKE